MTASQQCPHDAIGPTLDRWQECHWHLHQMEANFHEPDGFRYSVNSFIRAAKEVPGLLMKNLQRYPNIRLTIDPVLGKLHKNELFGVLKKRRDFIVHQGMLELQSEGNVRAMEGERVKMSIPFPVSPHERSDDAYERYKLICINNKVWRQISGPDCDSVPAIWRTWRIPQFGERDLLDVAFEAWRSVGEVIAATLGALGGDPLHLDLPCRHTPETVRLRRYSQYEFFLTVDGVDLHEEERKYRELVAAGKPKDPPL